MFFFDYDLMGKLYVCVSLRAFADDKMLVEAFYRIGFRSSHRTHFRDRVSGCLQEKGPVNSTEEEKDDGDQDA